MPRQLLSRFYLIAWLLSGAAQRAGKPGRPRAAPTNRLYYPLLRAEENVGFLQNDSRRTGFLTRSSTCP